MKKIIALITAAVTVMMIFGGCAKPHKPANSGSPFVFSVEKEDREWIVEYSADGVVTHSVRVDEEEEKTEITFSGKKKGTVNVTVYLAPENGSGADRSDNVYVLTLNVDRKLNVTESDPFYGAYSVNCGSGITGSEWSVRLSNENTVHWYGKEESFETDEDGMQGFDMIYTFTGRKPGIVKAEIINSLPWDDSERVEKSLWLFVDPDYAVHEYDGFGFRSFKLSEQGSTAGQQVLEAEKTDNGAVLKQYTEMLYWSDEINGYESEKTDEKTVEGGEELYRYLCCLLEHCSIKEWDGFSGSNSRVLDGTMFKFSLTTDDGAMITADGSNDFPEGYRSLKNGLYIKL